MEPLPETGARDARAKLVRRIEVLCDRIIRGRHATDRWQVKFHRALRLASIVLSSLGGAGLIAQQPTPGQVEGSSWAVIGSFISLLAGIALQVSNELGIERIALEARAAAEAFSLVEVSLEIVLIEEDPLELVTKLIDEAGSLLQKYHGVIPRFSGDYAQEAGQLTQALVQKFGADWNLPAQREKRRRS